MGQKVVVSNPVYAGLMEIKQSNIDMRDMVQVLKGAIDLGFEETASWVRNNTSDYFDGLFAGFEKEKVSTVWIR